MPVEIDDELTPMLDRHIARLRDVRPALQVVARSVSEHLAQTAQRRQSPNGIPWAPRKTTTTDTRNGRTRNRRPEPGSLLRRSGALLNARTALINGQALEVVARIGYAAFVHQGTRRSPARPLVYLTTVRPPWWELFKTKLVEHLVS